MSVDATRMEESNVLESAIETARTCQNERSEMVNALTHASAKTFKLVRFAALAILNFACVSAERGCLQKWELRQLREGTNEREEQTCF